MPGGSAGRAAEPTPLHHGHCGERIVVSRQFVYIIVEVSRPDFHHHLLFDGGVLPVVGLASYNNSVLWHT
jgi:hypothetical protein